MFMRQKVIIIGVTYATRLTLARAIHRAGYEVTLIYFSQYAPDEFDPNPPYDTYSNCVEHCYHSRKTESDLIPLLLEKCTDPNGKTVIIPACDYSISIIDANQDKLRDSFLFPNINHQQGEMISWMGKTRQKALARQLGLNVAEANEVYVKNGLFTLPGTIKYPCFPKPSMSYKGGKAGLVRCDNEDELNAAIRMIIEKGGDNISVLVEDYIDIDNEYAIVGLSDGEHVLIPALLQLLVVSKAYNGIALNGKVMPIDGFEDLIEQFKEYVRQTGFVGLFDIDFYESKGTFYFGEMNLRFGGSGHAVTSMGVNLPDIFVKFMVNGYSPSLFNVDSIHGSAFYLNDKLCLDDLLRNAITYREICRLARKSDVRFMPDSDDPKPYRKYKKVMNRYMFRQSVKHLVGIVIPKYRR